MRFRQHKHEEWNLRRSFYTADSLLYPDVQDRPGADAPSHRPFEKECSSIFHLLEVIFSLEEMSLSLHLVTMTFTAQTL